VLVLFEGRRRVKGRRSGITAVRLATSLGLTFAHVRHEIEVRYPDRRQQDAQHEAEGHR
jgi:hypothetical protein